METSMISKKVVFGHHHFVDATTEAISHIKSPINLQTRSFSHQIRLAGDTLSESYIPHSTIPLAAWDLHFPSPFLGYCGTESFTERQWNKTESALTSSP